MSSNIAKTTALFSSQNDTGGQWRMTGLRWDFAVLEMSGSELITS